MTSLVMSSPLLLSSFGALVSEYSGRMAVFAEGVINLSVFLCYLFVVKTGSVFFGITLSLLSCTIFIFFVAIIIEKFNANPFLASLGLNLFMNALISCISVLVFKTRGVLSSDKFLFLPQQMRIITTLATFTLLTLCITFLFFTRSGLYLRITGSDSKVLKSHGINVPWCRVSAWCIASFCASCSGCILSLRLSSFVPNISSGRGWLSLAAVFLGCKNVWATLIAAFAMTFAEYIASNIQNIFPNIASPVLIALPYVIALVFILFQNDNEQTEN
ncbi:MAG: ABC transporter permease [Treponema sp.]|nr:ABC transporter permease [Treponema sp.]